MPTKSSPVLAFFCLFSLVDSHLVHPIGRLIIPASEVCQLQLIN